MKKEATLFKRYMKDVPTRMRALRAKEDLKRQDSYLEEAHKEKLSQEEQEARWDPIEDVVEDERGNYIDLIKHVLLMTDSVHEDHESARQELSINATMEPGIPPATTGSRPSKKTKQKAAAAAAADTRTRTDLFVKASHNTRSQVRKRLKEGVKLNYSKGLHVTGTIDNPLELKDKTAPYPDEEIDRLLEDMAEIKHLLFCRLLLSHATVLPAAIRANSVEEFLNNSEVTDIDLRDLALKMDNAGLQDIRDACADLGRGEEKEESKVSDDDFEGDAEDEETVRKIALRKRAGIIGTDLIPAKEDHASTWAPDRERKIQEARRHRQSLVDHTSGGDNQDEDCKGKTLIDFGDIDDEGKFKSKKMRVKICGRYIHNYPSERAISRGGWLQFCLIAKDSRLPDAIKLCRHWDEFFDLNILANFQYFPAANWLVWKGDRFHQQLLQFVSFLSKLPFL